MLTYDGPGKWRFELKVPDYKTQKVDGIKQLELVRTVLARRGLTDPWLRNEVWRYPSYYEHPHRQVKKILMRGLVPALQLVFLTVVIEEYYWYKVGRRPPHIHNLYHYFFHPQIFPDDRRKE